MTYEILQTKVDKIMGLFNIDKVSHLAASSPTAVASYYKTNKLAYKIFHSRTDFIHMGLSESNKYAEKDLFKQAEIIESYFNNDTKNVLEIGCGKGKNLAFLANRSTYINFFGLDLEGGQTDAAVDKSKRLKNMQVIFGDYHDLSKFSDIKFDVVFVVEALCHSNDKAKVASEVSKILKQNGLFIVFDGYLGVEMENLNYYAKTACKLVEKGMMVDAFEEYEIVKEKVINQGFELVKENDYSKNILPTLYRFEKLASIAFSLKSLSKLLVKVLPSNFTNNAISGYLMPNLIETGIAKYYLTVFRKI